MQSQTVVIQLQLAHLQSAAMSTPRINGDDSEYMSEGYGEGDHGYNMVVPASHMENFLSTLKQYSKTCEANRNMIDDKAKDFIRRMEKPDEDCKKHRTPMDLIAKKIDNMWKNQLD